MHGEIDLHTSHPSGQPSVIRVSQTGAVSPVASGCKWRMVMQDAIGSLPNRESQFLTRRRLLTSLANDISKLVPLVEESVRRHGEGEFRLWSPLQTRAKQCRNI